ncbi:mechanosensitive ion channel [Glaciecola sp. MH2013]|uniref:mechanosensitive ion channel family protein n=1 Tax=Glaciecola sp. MH2013 TaxID=2785524 RepID=UPI00189C6CD4|nr:mechanosensitive ion channel domain-containing protein [Glaciecola sp. MH2013]MBF7074985.1 mechanosensitive ion channel [Glaciecola sp. MH2013]
MQNLNLDNTQSIVADTTPSLVSTIVELSQKLGFVLEQNSFTFDLVALTLIALSAFVGLAIARFILHFKVMRFVARSNNTWDDSLLENGVFRRFSHIVPGLIVYSSIALYFDSEQSIYKALDTLSAIYLLITIWLTLSAVLNAIEDIYSRSQLAKKAPITGFVQVSKLLLTLVLIFLLLSVLIGKSPIYLLSGLTAIAAVLLLIFRDTILGFVAGIQIAANRMFNTGDWIVMQKYGVDGEILEIGLNVVKVQNWDKTISTLPTYALTSDAVKNWRGMSESGGRRIKRSIFIDVHSVCFADEALLGEWQKMQLLTDYLASKKCELENDRNSRQLSNEDILNCRRLTNLGTFRAYLSEYLKHHKLINHDLTCMVRQLKPSELGVALEIYCFSAEKEWTKYEAIQADIFDHVLAILPVFKLRAYQRVSGLEQKTR